MTRSRPPEFAHQLKMEREQVTEARSLPTHKSAVMTCDLPILSLDLARLYGFAEGVPGEIPTSGHGSFGPEGATHEAIFAKAMEWADQMFSARRYRLIIAESPIPPSKMYGLTNWSTSKVLITLPGIVLGSAYRTGQFDLRQVSVAEARKTLLGKTSLKGDAAKRAVRDECRRRGWVPAVGKISLDQTDALAIWHHGCALIDPVNALRSRGLKVKV
jgi:hypothetical protein